MFTRLDMASSQTVITLPLLLDGCQATPSFESASPSFEEINTMLSEILNTGFELVRISWMCPVGALYDELRQRHLFARATQLASRIRKFATRISKFPESTGNKHGPTDTGARSSAENYSDHHRSHLGCRAS